MADLPSSARDLLQSGRLAHLVTINPDGGPQVSCVWTAVEDDEVLVASIPPRQKMRNVQRDGRVALSMEAEGKDRMGLQHYLILYGHARVVDGGAPEALQHMATYYLGPGIKFPPMDNPPPGQVMRIAVDRVGGNGPWMEDGA